MAIKVTEYGPDETKLGTTSFVMKHCFFNPHDFAVTANHHVFFQVASLPMIFNVHKYSLDVRHVFLQYTHSAWWMSFAKILM